MTIKKHILIALAAIILMTTGAVASAQTSTTSTTTPTTITTPGVPNTGAGGDAIVNWLILATSGIVVLAGIGYIATRPRKESR